ncbi:hypothetical protein JHS3_15940 [Jeongeupia sp. HS-3]|uniref:hypothetical protein n=1 Tax=Jeongeupia sp. HS-3 TaxID=1009682 RepID=UPI0018A667A3|nr:hypothetical protein [Jeongeupia sp. HS-3]BCL75858.1 hypothetical protein JHS3_15940 [Jeongeupia sp. HS-3]
MYTLTGSALDPGLAGLIEFLLRVLFMQRIGHVVDKRERLHPGISVPARRFVDADMLTLILS